MHFYFLADISIEKKTFYFVFAGNFENEMEGLLLSLISFSFLLLLSILI